MKRHVKTLLMLAALLVLATFLGAGAAQASRGLSLSSTVIGASGVLTINGVITCDVLLALTLNSNTLMKTTGTNQGTANGGYIRNCSGSLAGSPNTGAILGPLNVQYASFQGTLPNITKINVVVPNAAWVNNTVAGPCLYAGNLTGLGFDIGSGTVRWVDFNGTNALPKSSGGFLCPSTRTISGVLATFLPAAPTVTLV